MKRLLAYLFLGLLFISAPSYADDIQDFQIEGISVGDSLLDYYSKEEIKKGKKNYYKDNEFLTFEVAHLSESRTYDGFQALYKAKDKKYIIYSITGVVDCKKDFTVCKKKWKEIVPELIEFFKNDTNISDVETYNHKADKSGKSKATVVEFWFNNGDLSRVICTDWGKKLEKENRWRDELKIILNAKEFADFLMYEYYK